MVIGLLTVVAGTSSIELFTAGFTLGMTLMTPIVQKRINKKGDGKSWDGFLQD